ncbi:hypothetical protein ACNOYE_12660 [Nannocystaceae bacterium ST9]
MPRTEGRWLSALYDEGGLSMDDQNEIFLRLVDERDSRISNHEELLRSPDFTSRSKHIKRSSMAFAVTVSLMDLAATRQPLVYENLLLCRSSSDFAQSAIAISMLIENGMLEPSVREMRYLLERAVACLCIDQACPTASIEDKASQLENASRIFFENAERLSFSAFDPKDSDGCCAELKDYYRKACAFVHPSRSQVESQLRRWIKGETPGFESAKELQRFGELLFRGFDLGLTVIMHGFGLPLVGDVFIDILDGDGRWPFHKGKYVAKLSRSFDYKTERQR